ncbi:molybdopterin-dependent oxidoreductase [Nitrincola nitratireducens]|uniref:Nitrate reductase n=1 Tax=Nitrincola nitratireducens TaxID=1229521 RepID=W9V4D9_9GAMM|nr:Nitrate reductase [Nitrincola nitratireducens]
MKQNTTCPYCGVGCGVTAELSDQRIIAVSGDSQHPANFGRLCIKGSTLHETTQTEQRLLLPRVDGQNVHWSDAIEAVASRIRQSLDAHGPGSIAMYLSGQLLTEDYYVANKLMKGFLGSSHVDTNSRLCMASTVAGHKRAFGSDSVPGCYEDIELADLIILVGSNAAWNHPILFQRIQAAKTQRPQVKVVVIDPRATATCELADLHLALKPGSDVALFNALLVHLAHSDALDQSYIDQHTEGFERAIEAARQDIPDIQTAARLTDIPLADLTIFFDWFTNTPRTLTLFSQGVNQSSSGTDKVNSLMNCHLATGRIGKPGSSPFSLTGQPNAMGGREVGGLANQLAAHMEFSPEAINRVQNFWNAPNMAQQPGHKAWTSFKRLTVGKLKYYGSWPPTLWSAYPTQR